MKKLIIAIFILHSTLAFAQCPTPTGLFTNNITHYNALANWVPVMGVDHYKIRYRTCGSSTWGNLGNIGATDSSRNLPLLQSSTCYEWQIIAYCDSTNQQPSSWSITDTFTTSIFVPEPFNPLVINELSSTQCDSSTSFALRISQSANEPDIGTTTITSDGGTFNIQSISSGDSIGYAILNTNVQIIYSVLIAGFTQSPNYAIVNSYDSAGSLLGFFVIENLATGIKISSTSPNDGNNYTNGFLSEVYFNDLFINPSLPGALHFYADITSELNDFLYTSDTIIITCSSTVINEVVNTKTLINIFDIYGRISLVKPGKMLFYHFSDGTIEKKILLSKR